MRRICRSRWTHSNSQNNNAGQIHIVSTQKTGYNMISSKFWNAANHFFNSTFPGKGKAADKFPKTGIIGRKLRSNDRWPAETDESWQCCRNGAQDG